MHRRGFTLIEMMITVAIVAILASIAFPSYMQYVVRANRSAVQQFMLDIANREEQFMLDSRNYTATIAAGGLNLSTPAEVTGRYTVTVAPNNAATPPNFTITATAIGNQAANSDDDTDPLILTSAGVKNPPAKWK